MELGIGIGWRPEIADTVERLPGVDWVEVVAENVCPGHLPGSLSRMRARGTRIVPHGVSLGLGGADRPDEHRLTALAERAEALGAPLVTEHIAFVRAGGGLTATQALEAGHLLPVPRTRDALKVLCENVRIAQDSLPAPLALENIAALISWPDEELTEGQFLAELVERTGVRLLIDVANLHTNHVNLGHDPVRALDLLPVESIAYVHVAGGVARDGVWHDTHAHPVPPEVLDILAELRSRTDPPGVLLERDDAFPPKEELAAELTAIRTTLARAAREALRVGAHPAHPDARDTPRHTPAPPRAHDAETETEIPAAAAPGTAASHRESPTPADPAAVAAGRRQSGARPQRVPATACAARTADTHRPSTPEPTGRRSPATAGTRTADAAPPGTPAPARGRSCDSDGEARTAGRVPPHRPERHGTFTTAVLAPAPGRRAADGVGAPEGSGRGRATTGVTAAGPATRANAANAADEADDAVRVRLGIGQAAVLSALVAGTPAPEGFDSRRMRVQSRALSAKRADVVAKVAPELPEILGGGYRDAFLAYARNRPMRSGYRRDALDFAAHLLASGRVTDVRVRRRLTLWHDERAAARPPLRATRFVRAARAALTIR
ncbi:DUF692 family protein [Streptomyces sp. HNM0663]|uniref:DUF692 family protein n=1 Tax=Streptomyces chengmaiensis TaxID=3040919 RepID=A0ABT6HQT3_9ACTN|nr:DUF692 family multinuclear iron-containing protein [Streptomyces chengmaiensis]MDH2391080.1 DUF692 family protein [Streptomyces chengmaiensis]